MDNKALISKLKKLGACSVAVDWTNGADLETAWEKCERADWMLWFICKMEMGTQRDRIHIICDCAETALKYVPRGEDRPRKAIKAARKYADDPTENNREAAGAAAWAAEAAAGAAAWAAEAAWAARAAGAALQKKILTYGMKLLKEAS